MYGYIHSPSERRPGFRLLSRLPGCQDDGLMPKRGGRFLSSFIIIIIIIIVIIISSSSAAIDSSRLIKFDRCTPTAVPHVGRTFIGHHLHSGKPLLTSRGSLLAAEMAVTSLPTPRQGLSRLLTTAATLMLTLYIGDRRMALTPNLPTNIDPTNIA